MKRFETIPIQSGIEIHWLPPLKVCCHDFVEARTSYVVLWDRLNGQYCLATPRTIQAIRYCPFCGKKLKVIEAQGR